MVYLSIATSSFQSQVSDLLPCNNNNKSTLIYTMLKAYGLLQYFNQVIDLPSCSKSDFRLFHSKEYLEILLDPLLNETLEWEDDAEWQKMGLVASAWTELHQVADSKQPGWFESKRRLYQHFSDDTCVNSADTPPKKSRWDELQELLAAEDPELNPNSGSAPNVEVEAFLFEEHKLNEFGLCHDCHVFGYLPMYCHVVTGATLALARCASNQKTRTVSINWDGGRHHALRSKASGFCYVNDISILIQKLRRLGIQNVSYVDFDLHHGDGVERAFQYSTNVQSISVHLLEPGFFPGSGTLKDASRGKNVVNIPVLHGFDDACLRKVVHRIIIPCLQRHAPQVIVIQCGADGLMGDKYAEWQLTIKGLATNILELVRAFPQANIVLLGGGGYNEKLTSRFYTYLTWILISEFSDMCNSSNPFNRDEDVIPDHEFLECYKEEFYKFWYYDTNGCHTKFLKNDNSADYIERLVRFYDL
ncbi:LANO_0G09934g1_1 [Lachancea nothofagi CBS 11611]|uniref:histone deacetylase n=1 Tax=Lachancea nothofagi CBS 11611 TaxID=1266666 RepID=A0A1G4KIQ0_9SACH|nr:LANO_0G09934g1_1 [Lachancea nothofagi CBS 11611]